MINYLATIDIGFSAHSVALFDFNEKFITKVDYSKIDTLVSNYQLSSANTFGIVSSVKDTNFQGIPFKSQLTRRLLLHGTFRDMPVHHDEKIHDNRLVNAYYLYKLNDKKKLIIDCGHIVTVDFVDCGGLEGGYIMPGIISLKNTFKYNEYFKHFISNEEINTGYQNSLPQDNQVGIEQGILAQFYFAMKGIMKQYGPDELILTGVHAEAVASFMKETCKKNNIPIMLNRDLSHRALCYIAKRVYR